MPICGSFSRTTVNAMSGEDNMWKSCTHFNN